MFCNFSPIAFYCFGFPIHWYSLAYIFGILFAIFQAKHLLKRQRSLGLYGNKKSTDTPTENDIEAFLNFAVIGIIVGGRLGHVLFYDFDYYCLNWVENFKIWKGGMSFFGGFLGVVLSAIIFCKLRNINFLDFLDLFTVGTPIGLGLGRLANFVNGELLGKEADVSFGVIFSDGVLRHPSQVYEAILEGVVVFFIMLFCAYKIRLGEYGGALSGVFCLFYGVSRFIGEFFREPDSLFSEDLLLKTGLNLNQYMSFGIISLGILLLSVALLKKHKH